MLMVNNPGTWSHIYAPLDHAEWIGLTPTDLVFPFFMFCMGVAMYFSLRKFDFKFSPKLALKIVRRTVLLFLIGWAIHWFSHLMYGLAKGQPWAVAVNNLPTLRILGVFQRLALCYFFGSLCAIFIKHKMLPWVVGGILVIYAVILGVGHGYDFSLDNALTFFEFNLSIRPLLELIHRHGLQTSIYNAFYKNMHRSRSADALDVYRNRFYSYGVYGVLDEWIERGFAENPNQMAELARVFLDRWGIAAQ